MVMFECLSNAIEGLYTVAGEVTKEGQGDKKTYDLCILCFGDWIRRRYNAALVLVF